MGGEIGENALHFLHSTVPIWRQRSNGGGKSKELNELALKQQAEQEKKELEEQAEIERMKLLRKKGRPVLDDKNKKWLKDKTGRLYRKRFCVPKEKASGK